MRRARLVLLACTLWCGPVGVATACVEPFPLSLEPGRVEIGLLYGGVDLVAAARPPLDAELALLVTGPGAPLVLRERRRLWGLFWAPAGEVRFGSVPSLYLLRTTCDPRQLARPDVLEQAGVGYDSLQRSLGGDARPKMFRELVALKEAEGLFSQRVEGETSDGPPSPGRRFVLRVPARAPVAGYTVRCLAFRGGQLIAEGSAGFEVARSAPVAFVAELAQSHALAYGMFAVVVALGAGLLAGFVFGSGKRT